MKRSLVITFAGFTPSAVSCFGSSWNRTPAIDSLAADGVCWDRVVCSSTNPHAVWMNWWSERLAAEQVSRHVLITDDEVLADQLSSRDDTSRFDVVLQTIASVRSNRPADSIADTHLAALFRTAITHLENANNEASVWIYSRFLLDHWDAPRELFPMDDIIDFDDDVDDEEVQDDADDAEPACEPIFDDVTPPLLSLTDKGHVDLVMSWMRTYGCQIRLLDLLMDDVIEACEQADIPIMLAGASGFALGQNDFIGHDAGPLRSCHVAVPVVTNRGGPLRLRHLTGSDSLGNEFSSIASQTDLWLAPERWASLNQSLSDRNDASVDVSDASTVVTRCERVRKCVHSADWFYVCDSDDADVLFLKPDDMHDANDVSRLKPDLIDQFRQLACD